MGDKLPSMSDLTQEPDFASKLYRTFAAASRVTMAVERMMLGDPPGEEPDACELCDLL